MPFTVPFNIYYTTVCITLIQTQTGKTNTKPCSLVPSVSSHIARCVLLCLSQCNHRQLLNYTDKLHITSESVCLGRFIPDWPCFSITAVSSVILPPAPLFSALTWIAQAPWCFPPFGGCPHF